MLDANLSPLTATWLKDTFQLEVIHVRDISMSHATDKEIFFSAKKLNAVVMTKDQDFVKLLELHGPPPKVILLTCGNTSNKSLHNILTKTFKNALSILSLGENLVEITNNHHNY